MQAILKVNKGSAYSSFNGHTFRVVRLNSNTITLIGMGWDLLTTEVDFDHTEVLIVDLDNEIRSLESKIVDFKSGLSLNSTSLYISTLRNELDNLQRYCLSNGFEFNY